MPFVYAVAALIVVGILAWIARTYMQPDGNIRTVLNVVLALIVAGMGLWLINTYVPMAGSIKAILNIVVVVTVCVLVLQAFGLWAGVLRLWNRLTNRLMPH
jgi:predicted membrane protein